MSDKKLTQEEIDKMISAATSNSNNNDELTQFQLESIKEFIDKSLNASVDALETALSKKLNLNSSTDIKILSSDDITTLIEYPYIAVKIYYNGDVDGYDLLLMKKSGALELAKLQLIAMGIELDSESTLEMQNSAVLELMNQIVGKSACILSEQYDLNVDISTPSVKEISSKDDISDFFSNDDKECVSASYNYIIEGSDLSIDILKILDSDFAKNLNNILSANEETDDVNSSLINKMEDDDDIYDSISIDESKKLDYNVSPEHHNNDKLYGGEHKVDGNIPEVYPFKLSQIDDMTNNASFDLPISKLNEVNIELSVELGRTKKTIKEILSLGKGSVVELDKLSGEPVDLYANGTLIGHGEVVIIKDYFSIKILDVVDNRKEN